MYIIIVCFPVYDIINFEINLDFNNQAAHDKNNFGQKFKYFKNKKSFGDEIKNISIILKDVHRSKYYHLFWKV